MKVFIKNIALNAIGEIGSRVPFIITEIIIAKQLGVALYGFWAIIQLIVNYNNFAHFGLLSGLAKLEPMNLDKGDEFLSGIRSNAFWPIFFIDIVVFILIFCFRGLLPNPTYVDDIILPLIVLIFMQQLYLYAQVRLQNVVNFGLLSTAKLGYSVVFMGFVLLSMEGLTLHYLVASWAGAFFIASFFVFIKAGLLPKLEIRTNYIKKLFFVGFPIFLMGISKLLLVSMDKIFLVSFYSSSDLGAYNISLQAMLIMTIVIGLISRVFSPLYLSMHSRSEIESETFYLLVKRNSFIGGIIVATFCSTCFVFLIERFLPEFKDGIVPGIFLIFSGVYQGGIQLSISSTIARNREKTLLISYLGLGLVYTFVLYFFAKYNAPFWCLAGLNLLFWVFMELFVSKYILDESLAWLMPSVFLMLGALLSVLLFYSIFGDGWFFLLLGAAFSLFLSLVFFYKLLVFLVVPDFMKNRI